MNRESEGRSRNWLLVALPLVIAAIAMACGSAADDDQSAQSDDAQSEVAADTAEDSAGDDADNEGTTPDADETTGTTDGADAESGQSDDGDAATAEDHAPEITPVVYDGDFSQSIQPIFAAGCGSCHVQGGPGASHWVLNTAGDLAEDHQILAGVIASGYMPPWPAGGDSPAFKHDRSLRPDQIQAIQDWSADGGALDVAADTPVEPEVELVGLANPDLVVEPPAAYAGSPTSIDDYRCQIYDPQLPDGGWITAYEFIPDQKDVVHHAIGYMLPAAAMERAQARDGEDGRPGWPCFGSSGLGASDIFLGWAPGQDPSVMPDGTGLWVEPGGFVVVQVHYHYDGNAPADASTLALQLAEPDVTVDGKPLDPITVAQYVAPAEIPCSADEQGPLCDRDAALAAAIDRYGREGVLADGILQLCGQRAEDFASMTDGVASSSCDVPVGFVGGTGEIVSVLGHEHELGAWFKMTLNPGRPDERVLLDIPAWDFDWQYNYEPQDTIVLEATDVIRMECGWDRSKRPADLEPAYVLWADGTNDEMCFGTISTKPPT